MSPFKPMKRRDYEAWIRTYNLSLKKGSYDWKLISEQGYVAIRNIIITHPGNEVIPDSVKKTQAYLRDRGLE